MEVPRVNRPRTATNISGKSPGNGGLPVEPDALLLTLFGPRRRIQLRAFFYEADRGSMNSTDMLKKLEPDQSFRQRQQRHKESFAFTRSALCSLRQPREPRQTAYAACESPLVCGNGKRADVLVHICHWFCDSASDAKFVVPSSTTWLSRRLFSIPFGRFRAGVCTLLLN